MVYIIYKWCNLGISILVSPSMVRLPHAHGWFCAEKVLVAGDISTVSKLSVVVVCPWSQPRWAITKPYHWYILSIYQPLVAMIIHFRPLLKSRGIIWSWFVQASTIFSFNHIHVQPCWSINHHPAAQRSMKQTPWILAALSCRLSQSQVTEPRFGKPLPAQATHEALTNELTN